MKLLYILNVAKRVNNFSYTSMIAAQKLGIEFHIAGNWSYESEEERKKDEEKYGIRIHQIDFIRSPFSSKNYKAYKQLDKFIKMYKYDAIHCNTPIGGVLGRIAAKKNKISPVIYQAHGFHFYKGAPMMNWLLYYPAERILGYLTDAIITINEEDYIRSKSFKIRGMGKRYYVKGVGIDCNNYQYHDDIRQKKRDELGIDDNDIMVISSGNLDAGKNYELSIELIGKIKDLNIHYYICGIGDEYGNLISLIKKLGLEDKVHLLGFRNDVKELLLAADIFLFTTKREGLPRSMMEAMVAGLPCLVSNIRGNKELINASDGLGGYLCSLNDNGAEFYEKLTILAENKDLREKMGKENIKAINDFGVEVITNEMIKIYSDIFKIKNDN